MRLRTLGITALVGALALGAAACGSSSKSGSATTAAAGAFTPVTKGTLNVVTSLPAPGFWTGDDPDKIAGGYEWALAQELGKRLGLAVKVKNVDFTALQAGQVSDYDIALSQITINDARKKVNLYSDPYFSSDQGIMVNKGTTMASAADAAKLQWGAQSGTTGYDYLTATIKPTKETKVFQDTPSLFNALLAKQIDAVIMDTVIVLPQTLQKGYESTEVVGQFKTSESYGIQLPKDSKNLAAVNALLAAMTKDGLLTTWSDKYLKPADGLGGDPAKVPYIKVP